MSTYSHVVRVKDLSRIYAVPGRREFLWLRVLLRSLRRLLPQPLSRLLPRDITRKQSTIEVRALDGVSLDIRRGEYVSIMGPSGSGKSTLFNMIGGLDKPTKGSVFLDETDMAKLSASQMAFVRCREVGFIFQSFNLLPVMTALENVTLPMVFAGLKKDEAKEKAMGLLQLVGLGDRHDHKPDQLSGGQQQRVAIARAFANDPAIILADEPTGNLDSKTGLEIIGILKQINVKKKVTIISATHDLRMLDVSDRIVWIRDGKIEKIEDREDVDIKVGQMKE